MSSNHGEPFRIPSEYPITREPSHRRQEPINFAADLSIPLQNLSAVKQRMDSLQHFLSQSVNTNTLISKDQMNSFHPKSPPQSTKSSPMEPLSSPLLSRSRSPVKRERSYERDDRRSRSPKRHKGSPSPSRGRKRSPTPDDERPQERGSPSPRDLRKTNGSDYSGSPKGRSISPDAEAGTEDRAYKSPSKENGHSRSPSPPPRDDRSPKDDRSPIYDDEDNNASARRSESN